MANKFKLILSSKVLMVELFVVSNFSFLILDIIIAHKVNDFHHWAEWIPLYYSAAASLVLGINLIRILRKLNNVEISELYGPNGDRINIYAGEIFGWLAIFVGISGMFFHLESQFFKLLTIKSLVYTAPFIAPLAFTGLGFLLLLNRRIEQKSLEWEKWVLFFALGGFFGNFILSLADHAQNGFFSIYEWIPVISSGIAVGFLVVVLTAKCTDDFLKYCFYVMLIQIIVGISGFVFHLSANLDGYSANIMENFIHGAPIFAPLLLPNISILALIGLYKGSIK